MKKIILLHCFLLAAAGCTVSLDQYVPDIDAEHLRYTRTGKFSSTSMEVEDLRTSSATVQAAYVRIRHSNAWIPNWEIEATGYQRRRSPHDDQAAARPVPDPGEPEEPEEPEQPDPAL